MRHVLKCWPEHFEAVSSGRKKCEIRKNDRRFKVGDILDLREYQPADKKEAFPGAFTGRRCLRWVTHVLKINGTVSYIDAEMVVLSLGHISKGVRP